jgi:hypothetical protein
MESESVTPPASVKKLSAEELSVHLVPRPGTRLSHIYTPFEIEQLKKQKVMEASFLRLRILPNIRSIIFSAVLKKMRDITKNTQYYG